MRNIISIVIALALAMVVVSAYQRHENPIRQALIQRYLQKLEKTNEGKNDMMFMKNKRNDIEARLLELEAEIELRKAYSAMPAGHGRFNFDELGKRSFDTLVNLPADQDK